MHDVHTAVIRDSKLHTRRQNRCRSPIFLAITTGPLAAPAVAPLPAAAAGAGLGGPSLSANGLYLNAWMPFTISELDLASLIVSASCVPILATAQPTHVVFRAIGPVAARAASLPPLVGDRLTPPIKLDSVPVGRIGTALRTSRGPMSSSSSCCATKPLYLIRCGRNNVPYA